MPPLPVIARDRVSFLDPEAHTDAPGIKQDQLVIAGNMSVPVVMRKHHALGVARGASSVEYDGKVIVVRVPKTS